MNPRKRQATESLLPTLRPTKHPRTTRERYNGANSSPSQAEGILARWMSLGRDFYKLSVETFAQLMTGGSNIDASAIPTHVASPPPHPVTTSTSALPSRPPIPNQFLDKADSSRSHSSQCEASSSQPVAGPSIVRTDRLHVRRNPAPSQPEASTSGHVAGPSTTHTDGRRVQEDSTPATTRPARFRTHYPEIDAALATAERSISSGNRKRTSQREHIFAKNHKAQVQMARKKDKEEMIQELFDLRRFSGYSSDYRTFQNYLSYRARLELLEGRDVLSPSPSLTDLRTKLPIAQRSRRHSLSDDVHPPFLARALEKARETFNSPKPPKPFIPSFDQLRISARRKDEEIERRLRPKRPPLPPHLPPEDEAQVATLLTKKGVVSKFAREQVSDQDLSRLKPNQWLNDEIINFYGAMILARSEASKENPGINGVVKGKGKLLNIHYFSTFFWSKLKGDGYDKGRLAKWTKKMDIFEKDVILIPINHNNAHWTSAAINFRRKRIESYDSMGMDRHIVQKHLRAYLDAEHRNKKKKPFDFTGWEDYTSEDTPQQENGFDCGVFTCQFMEYLSRGEESFNFNQSDMPYLRKRMIWEIGNAKLRDDP